MLKKNKGKVILSSVMVMLPMIYSYFVYRQHKTEGTVYKEAPKSGAERIAGRLTAVIVPVILIGAAVLMFTGSIDVKCEDTALTIDATCWTDTNRLFGIQNGRIPRGSGRRRPRKRLRIAESVCGHIPE